MSEFLLDLVGDASPTAFRFTEDFENGTNGAALTTANTSFTTINTRANADVTFSNTVVVNGGLSAAISITGASNAKYLIKTVDTSSDYYARLWLYLPAIPTGINGSTDFFAFMGLGNSGDPSGVAHRLQVNTAGQIESWRNQTTALANTSTVALAAGKWYRIEAAFGPNAGNTITVYSAAGTLLDTFSVGFLYSKNYDQLYVGNPGPNTTLTNTPFTGYVDGVAASPQALPINFDAGTFTDSASVFKVFQVVSDSDTGTSSDSGVVDQQNAYSLSFKNGPDGGTYSATGSDTLPYTTTGSGNNITYTAGNTFDGSYGAKVTYSSTTNSSAYLTATANQNGSTHYSRFYVRFPTNTSVGNSIPLAVSVSSGGTFLAQVKVQSTGTLQLFNGTSTSVATSSTNVTATNNAQWYRLEWDQVGTTQTLRIYKGSNATPLETISGAAPGTAIDTMRYGQCEPTGTSAGSFYMDEIAGNGWKTPGAVTGGVLFVEDFENGTSGSVVDTSTTSFNSIIGTTGSFSSAKKYAGSLSYLKTSGATSGSAKWTLPGSTSTLYSRFYINVTTPPSSGILVIASVDSGSGTALNSLGINQGTGTTDFQLRLLGFNQGTSTSNSPYFSVNTWYRIEWDIVSSSSMQARIYLGESTVPIQTLVQAPNTGAFSNFSVADANGGTVAGQTFTVYWDAVKVSGTQQPGAIAPVVSASDTFTATDAATAAQLVQAADASSAVDAAALSASLRASDTASAADTGNLLFFRSDGDTGTFTGATPSLTVARPDSDTLSLADAGGITARNGNYFDGDAGLFTESTAIDRPQTASDSAVAGELQSLTAQSSTDDSGHIIESGSVAKATWRFSPPTQALRYPIRGSLLVTMNDSMTVLKKNGTYKMVFDPLAEDVEAADIAYLGGRAYAVDAAEMAALSAAGYGAYVALVPDPI